LRIADLNGRRLTAEDVGFQIGPRINASGRLGSAEKALQLLLADDDATARRLAVDLDVLNKKRREIEREVLVAAREEAGEFADASEHPVLVLAHEGWHQGVVGIVAARLTEEFGRPAIVIGLDGDRGRGSARTVGDFHILEAMSAAAPHLERYGGHAQAAGLEIRTDKVDQARQAIVSKAREMLQAGGHPESTLVIDADLAFEEMTVETMRHLDLLAPFGAGNEKPLFRSHEVYLAQPPRAVGADRNHLMLHLRRGDHVLKAMAFGMGSRERELSLGTPLNVVYTPRWNTFRGETNLEIEVVDFESLK
jgi:single-stranded-DNA-specific exonuclease